MGLKLSVAVHYFSVEIGYVNGMSIILDLPWQPLIFMRLQMSTINFHVSGQKSLTFLK